MSNGPEMIREDASPLVQTLPKLLARYRDPSLRRSLIEIAITSPNPTIPVLHLAKLISLGYVVVTAKGPVVTGDGLIRITESE